MQKNNILNINHFLLRFMIFIFVCFCINVMFPKEEKAKAMNLSNDEFDYIFIETVNEYINENCNNTVELVANKEIIYDIDMKDLGYIYDFALNTEKGYATVVNTQGYPEVAEIYFDLSTPLNGFEYNKIYIANTLYVYKNGTEYYFPTGEEISEEGIHQLREIAYYSANTGFTSSSETIYYTAKVETDVLQMAKRHPAINVINYSNACVPIAGANIIQYWDRFMPNLIENYTPGVAVGNYYLYNKPNNVVNNMAVQLYNLMGTNTTKEGTTINQFKSGMSMYCSSKGYGISYASCMISGRFDYLKAKEQMNNRYPLILFTEPFAIATIDSNENNDQIKYKKYVGAHSMAGFGFKDISYTLTNGQTRTDNYIEVASGMIECGDGYYNINYDTIIDDAYGINIF